MALLTKSHMYEGVNTTVETLTTTLGINQSSHSEAVAISLNPTWSVAIATYLIFLVATGLLTNGILVYIISSSVELHKISNYLILNLALGDLLTAIGNLPFDADFLFYQVCTSRCERGKTRSPAK